MTLNFAELSTYSDWAKARIANKEEPRDLGAFRLHVTALGGDPNSLGRYGVPSWTVEAPPTPLPQPKYEPAVIDYRPPSSIGGIKVIQGSFAAMPLGVILHGSRSGASHDAIAEFTGTAGYCKRGALIPDADGGYYVAWNVTIGPNRVGTHISPGEWGWNAGSDSKIYLAVEFSQPKVTDPISDAQVNAFCWWFAEVARKTWPNLPAYFPLHSETAQGKRVGKTDAFPAGSPQGNDLRARIYARLKNQGVRV